MHTESHQEKPIMVNNTLLDYVADLSCLLAYALARDNALDDQPIRGTAESLLLLRSGKSAVSSAGGSVFNPKLT